MLMSWIEASKFRQWLSRPVCSDAIKECKLLFDSLQGNRQETSVDSKDFICRPAPNDLQELTGFPELRLSASIAFRKGFLMQQSRHLGNSLIMINTSESVPRPYRISYIYVRGDKIRLGVHAQLPTSSGPKELLKRFKFYSGYLYSPKFSPQLEEVSLECVRGHYALWNLSNEVALVQDLPLVSILFLRLHVFNEFLGLIN